MKPSNGIHHRVSWSVGNFVGKVPDLWSLDCRQPLPFPGPCTIQTPSKNLYNKSSGAKKTWNMSIPSFLMIFRFLSEFCTFIREIGWNLFFLANVANFLAARSVFFDVFHYFCLDSAKSDTIPQNEAPGSGQGERVRPGSGTGRARVGQGSGRMGQGSGKGRARGGQGSAPGRRRSGMVFACIIHKHQENSKKLPKMPKNEEIGRKRLKNQKNWEKHGNFAKNMKLPRSSIKSNGKSGENIQKTKNNGKT